MSEPQTTKDIALKWAKSVGMMLRVVNGKVDDYRLVLIEKYLKEAYDAGFSAGHLEASKTILGNQS